MTQDLKHPNVLSKTLRIVTVIATFVTLQTKNVDED